MNEAYAPLYGFSALSQGQINQYIKMYLPIVDLRMVTLVTDAEDKLVAVGISMPSLSEALQKAKGRLLPMGWYHLMKVLFMHKYPPMLDLLLVAVKPEYREQGIMHKNDAARACRYEKGRQSVCVFDAGTGRIL